MRATPGTCPRSVSPVRARPSAPVRGRQHLIAQARSRQAARLGPPPECGGPMRATPGTGPWNGSPVHVRPSAPVRERQHVIAEAGAPQQPNRGHPLGCDPNGATRENRARAAPGGRRTPLPRGPIGATPRMRGPNQGHRRNVSPERISGTFPPESANQRAPTCDCQGEVATSGPVGATPQAVTQGCDLNWATRENRARAAPG